MTDHVSSRLSPAAASWPRQDTQQPPPLVDVVLPVLNEAQALPWVLGRMPEGYRPIVVDNGSTDGSGPIATAHGATVVREPRPGFGAACWAGLGAAETEHVCFMDCDGSLDPRDLPAIAAPVLEGSAQLSLGSRDAEKGAWPAHARIANRVLTWELRRRTGVRLTDLGPMRAAPRQGLLDLGIEDRRFGWPLEMVLRAARARWTIVEAPVPYRARSGKSKVTGTVRGTVRAVRDMAGVLE
ncbi:MAG: glycosyltransferase family 2 protein [Solirubrobacterales bacterium]|jgi:glycosyltransferase involved in cell wall biosynthesis|nr:glycosyltransferase family 2 protein [Solirubrobacterales bacterium]